MTGKTASLKKLIKTRLDTVPGETYYRISDKDAVFPYKTFSLDRANMDDTAMDSIDLCVDVWDCDDSPATAEIVADLIEALFNGENLPNEAILPTFWRASRYPVTDDDKRTQHIQLHFDVQLYET